MTKKRAAQETTTVQRPAGGTATDDGGRPVTDDGGRPVVLDPRPDQDTDQ